MGGESLPCHCPPETFKWRQSINDTTLSAELQGENSEDSEDEDCVGDSAKRQACSLQLATPKPKGEGGDLPETSLLVQGLLTAREFFGRDDRGERTLRQAITRLWEGVEWDWYARGGDVLMWHWSPKHEFGINLRALGALRVLRRVQSQAELGGRPVPLDRPGADRGDDRELPHGADLGDVHAL